MKVTFIVKSAILTVVLIFGVHFYSSSQRVILDLLPPGYYKVDSSSPEKGLNGSPWLSDSWTPGTIQLKNGKTIEGYTYRYNVYRNKLLFLYENTEYEISSPDSINLINLAGKDFVYQDSDPLHQGEKRFLEIAIDGKAKLYINYYPEILLPNYNKALNSGTANETITIKQSFLIKVGTTLTVLDKKCKLFPVIFSDKKSEISAFINKENISCKERSDVEKVVKYYNSLK